MALLVSCGGGTTGGSAGPPPPPPALSNPRPALTSLTPNSATAGGAAFTLAITGQNFVSAATVQWNGSARPTTFSSSSQLQAQISATDIANTGAATVSVTNPSPGGGTSGRAEFQINGINPPPSLGFLSPSVVDAGSPGFLLTVGGSNFVPASTIQWNGSPMATTYLSDTRLEAQIPAGNVADSGFVAVSVQTPTPGGGASAPLPFSINYLPTVLNLWAYDLLWDNSHQLIYLSRPSLAASNGNTITALDPLTGNIQATQFAGSEPDRLAISDDDQYLYAGLDGSSSVQRFLLPGLQPDTNYSLGAVPFFGPTFAWDLQVAPGLAHSTAVSRAVFTTSPWSALAGLEVYDDSTPRSAVAFSPGNLYDSLQWGSDTAIYANNAEVSNFDLYALSVTGAGVTQTADYRNVFSQFYMSIHYELSTNRIYGDDGTVVNPANGQVVAYIQASGLMVPDGNTNSAYFLGQTAFQFGTNSFTLESFDLTTLTPLAEIVIPAVQGTPLHLIRWGNNGLAFNDNAGYVYIINNNSFVVAASSQRLIARTSVHPVTQTRSFPRVTRPSIVTGHSPRKNNPSIQRRSSSSPVPYSVTPNPAPSIISLSPNTVSAGASGLNGLVLTVFGTNFLSLSTIEWNGTQRPTQFVSTTELQAQISFSDTLNAGSVSVTVNTPSPGGGNSNTLPFTILGSATNHAPILTSIYPNSAPAGSPGFTLNINGFAYFTQSTIVEWNGMPRPATLYSPGQLQIQVNASDLLAPGYARITAINPGPGGGTAVADFQILYEPVIVNETANDMVWDPVDQLIYFSVPGSASSHANQICALNPANALVLNCQNAGSEPNVLAISDDSHFLYVGEDGSNLVQRFVLPSLMPDISYSLGSDPIEGAYFALDLQVAPGAPHTVAISKGILNLDPHCIGGITIYDDSTPRPTSAAGWGPTTNCYNSLQWGANASTLYAACSENSTLDFYTLDVNSSGVTLSQDYPGDFWNPGRIHYDRGSGLIYSDDGFHALNPATGLPAGLFEVGGGWPMAPDSTLNRNFMLDQFIFQGNNAYTITVFDMTHYVALNRIPFSTAPNPIHRLGRFIRWGSNGLALNDVQGTLYLLSGSFIN